MRCETCREALSAELDGEETGLDPRDLRRHLVTCEACRRYDIGLERLHREVRVRSADAVPDLTASIFAATAAVPMRREWDAVRSGLLFSGLLLLVFAVPLLMLDGANMPPHLAAWDAAFGAALLVAALQPERARGLLPMALAMAATMTIATLVEIRSGHDPAHGLPFHVVELGGVMLLWIAARVPRAVAPDDGPGGLHLA
jgi:predicted anti-sigma-YlaC factor YlaD